MYVVTVMFEIRPECSARFLAEMTRNAAVSLREETGCRQFDVCTAPDAPGRCFLYEIYDSQAAFELHLKSAHFAQFNSATQDWVLGKEVATFTRAFPA